jgi:kynureninase
MTDFQWTKSQFYVPEGMIYLDGNSLGPLPLNAKDRVGASMTDQWGEMLITGWNKAADKMFQTVQKTQSLWMWRMEYEHHEQRPLYFGEWF